MKLIHYLFLFLVVTLLQVETSFSQIIGGKDCIDATPILNWNTVTFLSSPGEGNQLSEINTSQSCLTSGERNNAWFIFYTTSDGLISFNIIPTCANADYDFAVYDITNFGCVGISTHPELEIACNFSGSTFPSSTTGANNGLNSQDEPAIQAQGGGIYVLLVNNFSGSNMCDFSLDFTGSTAQLGNFNEIIGHVNYDSNDICGDGIEIPINHQKINVLNQSGNLVGVSYTDDNGVYTSYLPVGQTSVTVEMDNVNAPFTPTCYPAQQTVTFTSDTGQSLIDIDFALHANSVCTQYDFEYQALLFRRCFSHTNYVKISNNGNTSAPLDFTLTYPSNQIYPLSASIPFENIGNNTYLFHAPAVAVFQQLIVSILDTTTCETSLGDYVCVEGELLVTNDCLNDSTSLQLVLSADTLSNTITVANIGQIPMPNYFTLYIYNDYDAIDGMFQSISTYGFTLGPNESFPANVFTENWLALLIDSEGNFENLSISNVNTPYVPDTTSELNNPTTDAECAFIIGSYDPNDKQGFPEGDGELNRIEDEQSINYRIRFQNTGSDTAFTVVVRDTLSDYLDYSSVIPGASSHPYSFHLEENRLEFKFNEIDLVQKSLNEPASIGFVEFKVKQKNSNPISYTIENQAAIYFDFNDPIYTPVHIYSIYPMPVGISEVSPVEMNVSPNPSTGNIAFYFTNKWQEATKTIVLSDLSGRVIKSIKTAENSPNYNWNELPAGTYLLTVITKNGMRTSTRWTKI